MSAFPSTSNSHSNFVSIFNAALGTYKRRTKIDLASDPLLPSLQSCESPDAILAIFRDQIPAFGQSQNGDNELTKWVTPTVTVLYAFSATIGQATMLAPRPASEIFAGIGVLLLAAEDPSAIQDNLIDVFNCIEQYFRRLEAYTGITPTTAPRDIIVDIMVEVLTILAFSTKEMKRGRLRRGFKKLIGNTDIEDSLQRLDELTQEEARMASAELFKVTHSVDDRMKGQDVSVTSRSAFTQTVSPSAPHMIPNSDADSALQSTFEDTVADCPQIRILVIGKTGCGKSSLINKVFGVEKDGLAKVSDDRPGECDINFEILHRNNDRFILHDSEGFEPGQDAKLKAVKRFIAERTRSEIPLKDRLHVVWICISVPKANDRVVETGVQEVFEMVQQGRIPAIVIFTKYDVFVTTTIGAAGDRIAGLDNEKIWQYGEEKASEDVESRLFRPWRETLGEVPLAVVSTRPRFKNTIQKLIEATDKEIPRREGVASYTEAVPLNWASAQRGDNSIKIRASVDVGRKRYWRGLLSSVDFTQKKLLQCLDVIHRDIVAVWNIRDPNAYLMGNNFKAEMLILVNDLVANPNTSTPSDGLTIGTLATLVSAATTPAGIVILSIGTAFLFAKWVFDVYQNTSRNMACVMAYIVNLTIVMHQLSAVDISEESVLPAIQGYVRSPEIAQVHNDIRTFCKRDLRLGDKDHTLDEIIRLIEKHRLQAYRHNRSTAIGRAGGSVGGTVVS